MIKCELEGLGLGFRYKSDILMTLIDMSCIVGDEVSPMQYVELMHRQVGRG